MWLIVKPGTLFLYFDIIFHPYLCYNKEKNVSLLPTKILNFVQKGADRSTNNLCWASKVFGQTSVFNTSHIHKLYARVETVNQSILQALFRLCFNFFLTCGS